MQPSWVVIRKKAQQQLNEGVAKEDRITKKVGRKPTKDKKEEVAKKEKSLGIQTTTESLLVAREKFHRLKSPRSQVPPNGQLGGSSKPPFVK